MNFRLLFIIGLILFLIYAFLGIFGVLTIITTYFVFFFVVKKRNKVITISGETGSGKSLIANYFIQKKLDHNKRVDELDKKGKKHNLKKYNIYSTFYIKGAYVLSEDFYNYQYPPNSILVIDEAQIMFDSREHGKLTKTGVSNAVKSALSMHRHHKLDIYFITQNPKEEDAIIRRYSNELLTMDHLVYFRKFKFIFDKFKIQAKERPVLLIYKSWASVSDYIRWYDSLNPELSPRDFGARTKFAIISERDCETYNTEQNDSYYDSLPMIKNIIHDNPDALINTGKKNG